MANKEDFHDISSPSEKLVNKVGNFNKSNQPPEERGVCFCCGQRHWLSGCQFKVMSEKKGCVAKMCNFQKHEPPSTRYVKDISQGAHMNESALQADCGDEMVDFGLYTINWKGKSGSEYQVQL